MYFLVSSGVLASAAMDGDPSIRVSAEERAAARAEKNVVRADEAIVQEPPAGDLETAWRVDASEEIRDAAPVVQQTDGVTVVASDNDVKEHVATIDDAVTHGRAGQNAERELPPPEPPPIVEENVFRRMTRSSTRASFYGLSAVCMNLSLQAARKRRGAEADAAGEAEIRQIVDRGIVRGEVRSGRVPEDEGAQCGVG